MRRVVLAILAALALIGCGAAPAAQAPTVAVSTAVPTALPLEALDLEPLLVQPGDLPAGMSGAQVRDTAPKMFDGMPGAQRTAYQQFARGSEPAGGVAVFLYEADADRDQGYGFVLGGMGPTVTVEGVGDHATATEPSKEVAALLNFSDLLFQRCHAVAHIRMTGTDAAASIAAYAKRLDKRLSAVVC